MMPSPISTAPFPRTLVDVACGPWVLPDGTLLPAAANATEEVRRRLNGRSCVYAIIAEIMDFNDAAWYVTASVDEPRIAITVRLTLWSRWPSEEVAREDLARFLAETPWEHHGEIAYSPPQTGDYGRFCFEAVCLLPDPSRQPRPRNTEPPSRQVTDLVNSLTWKTTREQLAG